ncbi:MAG: hypothetical protein M1415_07185, partial [Firmicutes bacterium]|nr:hypothetical protein [Bacillota bacterium]
GGLARPEAGACRGTDRLPSHRTNHYPSRPNPVWPGDRSRHLLDLAPRSAPDRLPWYPDHGTREPYHSEYQTDLDWERLLSGTFATHDWILHLGMLAFNLLRVIEQETLAFYRPSITPTPSPSPPSHRGPAYHWMRGEVRHPREDDDHALCRDAPLGHH